MSPSELAVAKNPATEEEAKLQNEGTRLLMPAVMSNLMESSIYQALPYNNVEDGAESRSAVLRRAVTLARMFGLIQWVDTSAAEMVSWMALNNQTIPDAITVAELRAMNASQWPNYLATLRQEAIEAWEREGRKWDAIGVTLSKRLSIQKKLMPQDFEKVRSDAIERRLDGKVLPSLLDGVR
jgi:hypothetical protein